MGQLLKALEEIENRSPLSRPAEPVAIESLASVDEDTTPRRDDRRAAIVDQEERALADPRYRELIEAILSQVATRDRTVLLMAGFAEDEPRAGQLAECGFDATGIAAAVHSLVDVPAPSGLRPESPRESTRSILSR